MSEDRGIVEAIGSILQKWNARNDKRKKEKKAFKGLENKLNKPNSSLTKRERLMLDTQLRSEEIIGRTDEGALMGIRASDIGRKIGI